MSEGVVGLCSANCSTSHLKWLFLRKLDAASSHSPHENKFSFDKASTLHIPVRIVRIYDHYKHLSLPSHFIKKIEFEVSDYLVC